MSGVIGKYQENGLLRFQITGIVLVILGCVFAAWAVASNKFFYGFLRIAREAGHSVCASGAYQLVRHPAYLGAIIIDFATPLMLNSAWAFIPAIFTALSDAPLTL